MHEQKPLWHEYWILLPSTRCLSFNQKLWDICCSITESCPALGNSMDCSMPAFPILYYLLELAQIHWADNAIQPSHPLLPSSPPALNLSQHQDLFQWVGSSHQMARVPGASVSASVLPMNIQGWFLLGSTGLISLKFKGLSRAFSSTTVRKHQFFGDWVT